MKRAVSIGWNRVDPRKWGGWRGDLPDCELDASRMAAACELLDAPAIPLLTAVAKRTMCRLTLWESCAAMAPGDTLIVHTSGHGGQRVGGNEPDGREEYICAYDGPIDDDTVWYWLSNVPAGVRVVWFCDTCHSGGMARNRVAPFVFRLIPDELQCGVILISGCSEAGTSQSTGRGGLLTNAVLASGLNKSPVTLFGIVKGAIDPHIQAPEYHEYGIVTDDMRHEVIA